ncbi:AAA family ATPase [uncultured Herbaspirillum sp.]|uniref:AAA family ATPase n=1 Tax=uncultured Herbaspirillum sp. TaxID=160236 RepID=UPI00259115B5|nr:AAA family ATPase [uncultured Herbaspirillum sp.]
MSISGIRSNRGDGYQTLVALDWALSVLSSSLYQWIEIDSVSYSVDDVVIGKADGSLIACQCKKNQVDFNAWTVATLSDELIKAARLLVRDSNVEVRFYSRNNFGALHKLKEHISTQPDEISYQQSLSAENRATALELSKCLSNFTPTLSIFEFLSRTRFETSRELGRMQDDLRERLCSMASNPAAAFDALWTSLDQLGARMSSDSTYTSTRHRLYKDDLTAILFKAGAMLVPPMDIAKIRSSFSDTSGIGRPWRRDIASLRIPQPVVNELIAAIDAKKRSILLTGLPGSGKTCAMLSLQEALEKRASTCADFVPLFIQSREFADLVTSQDRQAQGLPEKWIEKIARVAEQAYVTVVIDSLDVLSIARDHRVLSYFLAQIDRLLLIPNVSVVTACREFDRHYDREIAQREWDCELTCQPLDWNDEVAPLLTLLKIDITNIDGVTRELIRNPRELALFVELAQQQGSFNVVTSQALAQRYLNIIVRDNDALGSAAIQAIEDLADEMLKSRSLALPYQRFSASQDVRRALCSLNVLQETRDGRLTFGHQSLLDVLVISGALRRGLTLNDFIHDLSPVPFVRPSIRSFVLQLAQGDRREFRKQLRTVLTSNVAFHMRRLVAESFAEQKPQDEDWSLIRDLRNNYHDVYQVIYTSTEAIEWHHFWRKHLLSHLMSQKDAEGMTRHIFRMGQWKNEDPAGVLALWRESLSLDWLDTGGIAEQLGFQLSDINTENLVLFVPLLEHLLDLAPAKHRCLGGVLARCVRTGVATDALLWRYIVQGVSDESLTGYRLGSQLRCESHEFGNDSGQFLRERMLQSTMLLELALGSFERWSDVHASWYGGISNGYRSGFLSDTSYGKIHSQKNINYENSLSILLGALEAAILLHAETNSAWWQDNRDRLCFSHEGALAYMAIVACTVRPDSNIDLIGRMLCDKALLEFKLTYELGGLIKAAFPLLKSAVQDAVMATALRAWEKDEKNEDTPPKTLRKRAELIVSIPSYLRSFEAQALIDEYEKNAGALITQPYIYSLGGMGRAPFSYEVFLNTSDTGVLHLLAHYSGYGDHYDDLNVGGEREVGTQLHNASSRRPVRFLGLLQNRWGDIPAKFRDDIMEGVAAYLSYRYGNVQTGGDWQPLEEPDAAHLASQILDELDRHPIYWRRRRPTANALAACAHVIREMRDAERLTFLAVDFAALQEGELIKGESVNLLDLGFGMAKGNVAYALMILATNFAGDGKQIPELLTPTLRRYSCDPHLAIRAMVLHRLPYLQSKDLPLGWELFDLVMQDANGLWEIAEPCLYYSYHDHFEIVAPLLARIFKEGKGKDFETWGRISALAALVGHINLTELLEKLTAHGSTDAWLGAATVWTNSENIRQYRESCFAGISAGLNVSGTHSLTVAEQMGNIFDEKISTVPIPLDLIRRSFSVLQDDEGSEKHHRLFGIRKWLNAISQYDPVQALEVTEIYLAYVKQCKAYLYDHENSLTQLMTRLFAEAEEQEESDSGAMLKRVVGLQDMMLTLGVSSVAEWLKAAENHDRASECV